MLLTSSWLKKKRLKVKCPQCSAGSAGSFQDLLTLFRPRVLKAVCSINLMHLSYSILFFFSFVQNRELQIMRKLDHCNIVRLRYFFYSSGDKVSRLRGACVIMQSIPDLLFLLWKLACINIWKKISTANLSNWLLNTEICVWLRKHIQGRGFHYKQSLMKSLICFSKIRQ